MGAPEDLQFLLSGLDFNSKEEIKAWRDEVILTAREGRRVDQFIAEWETELSQALVERLNADSGAIREQHDKTLAETNAAIRATLDVKKAMLTGRTSSAEGLREIARHKRAHDQALDVAAALRRSVQAWDALSDGTAEDFADSRRGRFRTAPRTRRLTGAYLAGQEDSPFRKKAQ
jgi:hypothetical protein